MTITANTGKVQGGGMLSLSCTSYFLPFLLFSHSGLWKTLREVCLLCRSLAEAKRPSAGNGVPESCLLIPQKLVNSSPVTAGRLEETALFCHERVFSL